MGSTDYQLKVNSRQFRSDLNRRMGIRGIADKAEAERIKRDRRQWVLEECIKKGMDLRATFNSYPYETKMYPTIKWITHMAPADWGWDRITTRDVVRTLCWDRVRTMNRRARMSKKAMATQMGEANSSTKINTMPYNRQNKMPQQTVSERTSSTGPLTITSTNNVAHPRIPPQEVPWTTPIKPADTVTFSVRVLNKIREFRKDITFNQFDQALDNYFIAGPGEMRCYRALSGTKKDREWKPLGFEEEFNTLLSEYSRVGVEVKMLKQASCFSPSIFAGPLLTNV